MRLDQGLHTAVRLKHTGHKDELIPMKHEVATSTSISPAYHPQPVSPLQQQRPLVGDGLRLRAVWWEGDKYLSMHTPLAPPGRGVGGLGA
ncbi:MAG: hypothetical protein CFE32_02735 [Alphaproteobacteria bacterium PA3]|nr:MAG: hypothetical protein CFE32_02735 [Alphaproteobacteria bacterium PA3]